MGEKAFEFVKAFKFYRKEAFYSDTAGYIKPRCLIKNA
jgi:hypothetical protein